MIPPTCGIYKIIQVNIYTKQKQTHIENKFMVTKGQGWGE